MLSRLGLAWVFVLMIRPTAGAPEVPQHILTQPYTTPDRWELFPSIQDRESPPADVPVRPLEEYLNTAERVHIGIFAHGGLPDAEEWGKESEYRERRERTVESGGGTEGSSSQAETGGVEFEGSAARGFRYKLPPNTAVVHFCRAGTGMSAMGGEGIYMDGWEAELRERFGGAGEASETPSFLQALPETGLLPRTSVQQLANGMTKRYYDGSFSNELMAQLYGSQYDVWRLLKNENLPLDVEGVRVREELTQAFLEAEGLPQEEINQIIRGVQREDQYMLATKFRLQSSVQVGVKNGVDGDEIANTSLQFFDLRKKEYDDKHRAGGEKSSSSDKGVGLAKADREFALDMLGSYPMGIGFLFYKEGDERASYFRFQEDVRPHMVQAGLFEKAKPEVWEEGEAMLSDIIAFVRSRAGGRRVSLGGDDSPPQRLFYVHACRSGSHKQGTMARSLSSEELFPGSARSQPSYDDEAAGRRAGATPSARRALLSDPRVQTLRTLLSRLRREGSSRHDKLLTQRVAAFLRARNGVVSSRRSVLGRLAVTGGDSVEIGDRVQVEASGRHDGQTTRQGVVTGFHVPWYTMREEDAVLFQSEAADTIKNFELHRAELGKLQQTPGALVHRADGELELDERPRAIVKLDNTMGDRRAIRLAPSLSPGEGLQPVWRPISFTTSEQEDHLAMPSPLQILTRGGALEGTDSQSFRREQLVRVPRPGELVELQNLETETGQQLNGRVGVARLPPVAGAPSTRTTVFVDDGRVGGDKPRRNVHPLAQELLDDLDRGKKLFAVQHKNLVRRQEPGFSVGDAVELRDVDAFFRGGPGSGITNAEVRKLLRRSSDGPLRGAFVHEIQSVYEDDKHGDKQRAFTRHGLPKFSVLLRFEGLREHIGERRANGDEVDTLLFPAEYFRKVVGWGGAAEHLQASHPELAAERAEKDRGIPPKGSFVVLSAYSPLLSAKNTEEDIRTFAHNFMVAAEVVGTREKHEKTRVTLRIVDAPGAWDPKLGQYTAPTYRTIEVPSLVNEAWPRYEPELPTPQSSIGAGVVQGGDEEDLPEPDQIESEESPFFRISSDKSGVLKAALSPTTRRHRLLMTPGVPGSANQKLVLSLLHEHANLLKTKIEHADNTLERIWNLHKNLDNRRLGGRPEVDWDDVEEVGKEEGGRCPRPCGPSAGAAEENNRSSPVTTLSFQRPTRAQVEMHMQSLPYLFGLLQEKQGPVLHGGLLHEKPTPVTSSSKPSCPTKPSSPSERKKPRRPALDEDELATEWVLHGLQAELVEEWRLERGLIAYLTELHRAGKNWDRVLAAQDEAEEKREWALHWEFRAGLTDEVSTASEGERDLDIHHHDLRCHHHLRWWLLSGEAGRSPSEVGDPVRVPENLAV